MGVSALQTLIFLAHKYGIQALYLITISTSTLISPCHKYWISDLEKTRNINVPTEISLHQLRNFC